MAVPQTVTINLYRNRNDAAVVGKKLVHGTQQIKGTFRGEVNIITPTLSLEKDVDSTSDICDLNEFNYLYVIDLNRYYFVKNVTIMPTGLMVLSLLEDVLQSYKKSIRNMTCFVERCENSTYIDNQIPDQMAIPYPAISVSSTSFSTTTNNVWRSCEDVWSDVSTENSKLAYIVTFSSGVFSCKHKQAYEHEPVMVEDELRWRGPCPKVICTKGWLNHFFKVISSLGASILDKWTSSRECILSIETIPEVISYDNWQASGYYCVRKVSARIPNSNVVTKMSLNSLDFGWPDDDGSESVLYGFLLNPEHNSIITTTFSTTRTTSTDWQNSSQYTKYSVKFNPFGEIEIPGDEVLGTTKIYLEVKHSLITGQAQLYYYTSKNTERRLAAEANLNFQQPFLMKSNIGDAIVGAVKTVASIAIGSKIAGERATTETTIPVTETIEFKPDASKGDVEYGIGMDEEGRLGATRNGQFGLMKKEIDSARLSLSYTKNSPVGNTQKSVSTASSTAKSINFGTIMSSVGNALDLIPKPELKGSLKAVMTDTTPRFIILYRSYIYPDIHHVGKPCYKQVELSNLALATNDGGYAKVGTFSFYNFRQTGDPEPLDSELEMIGNYLTSGVIISNAN